MKKIAIAVAGMLMAATGVACSSGSASASSCLGFLDKYGAVIDDIAGAFGESDVEDFSTEDECRADFDCSDDEFLTMSEEEIALAAVFFGPTFEDHGVSFFSFMSDVRDLHENVC